MLVSAVSRHAPAPVTLLKENSARARPSLMQLQNRKLQLSSNHAIIAVQCMHAVIALQWPCMHRCGGVGGGSEMSREKFCYHVVCIESERICCETPKPSPSLDEIWKWLRITGLCCHLMFRPVQPHVDFAILKCIATTTTHYLPV